MKINYVFDRFTSKAYSATLLSRNFHLYLLKIPKQIIKFVPFRPRARKAISVVKNIPDESDVFLRKKYGF